MGPLRYVSNILERVRSQVKTQEKAFEGEVQPFKNILESQETTHAKSGNTNLSAVFLVEVVDAYRGVLAFSAMHFSLLFRLMSTFQGNLQPNERPVRHHQHDEQWQRDMLAQKRFANLPAPCP